MALADQLIGTTPTDLDRADRRRHLLDVAAQPGDRDGDLLFRQVFSRNRLQQFTFGVFGGCGLAQPDGGGIGLRGRRQQAEDLGGALHSDHQHAGRHRVQRPRVSHPSGGKDPATTPHHVVTGHGGWLVDDDDSRTNPLLAHSTIAVNTSPRSTDQRPLSAVSGGPDNASGSIRIRETNAPVVALSASKVM